MKPLEKLQPQIDVSALSMGRTTENLKYQYSDDELNDLKTTISSNTIQMLRKEDELKELTDPIRKEIKELKTAIRGTAENVKNGFEFRDMVVDNVPNYDNKTIDFITAATGEHVGSRPMTYDERSQLRLNLGKLID